MAKALIVSAGNNANEYLARHIGELGYTRPTIVASGGEARRRMDTNDFEVVIINTPLPDEFGHELGTDAVEKTDAGVILLAKTGTAEQIADKLQDFGVLVLAKPFTGAQFRQAVQIAASNYKRLAVLRAENAKLLDKIAQLRLVDRAKCYLIEKKGLTVITDDKGRPVRYEVVAKDMRNVKAAMQHPDAMTYVTHGLRKNATIELYQAGNDDELVKAVTGHSGAEMLKKYGGQIRQKELATRAQEARNRWERNKPGT